jgi:hypothetical protein
MNIKFLIENKWFTMHSNIDIRAQMLTIEGS